MIQPKANAAKICSVRFKDTHVLRQYRTQQDSAENVCAHAVSTGNTLYGGLKLTSASPTAFPVNTSLAAHLSSLAGFILAHKTRHSPHVCF